MTKPITILQVLCLTLPTIFYFRASHELEVMKDKKTVFLNGESVCHCTTDQESFCYMDKVKVPDGEISLLRPVFYQWEGGHKMRDQFHLSCFGGDN